MFARNDKHVVPLPQLTSSFLFARTMEWLLVAAYFVLRDEGSRVCGDDTELVAHRGQDDIGGVRLDDHVGVLPATLSRET